MGDEIEPAAEGEAQQQQQGTKAIPVAQFIEDVEAYCEGKDVDAVLKGFQERMQQYKFLEMQLTQRKASLMHKLPEIKKTLDLVRMLKEKADEGETVTTDFELSSGIFAKANINKPEYVCLWLGANVMVEYTFTEAIHLLEVNLSNAEQNSTTVAKDLADVRESITITEVSMARVYNHDVRRKRMAADAAK